MRWPLHPDTGTIDVTTTGRRSGRAIRIEIWYVVVGGEVYLTGSPGPRNWLANLRQTPEATLHVGAGKAYPIGVLAEEVTDADERRALVPGIWAVQPWYEENYPDLEDWVRRSPMVRLTRLE